MTVINAKSLILLFIIAFSISCNNNDVVLFSDDYSSLRRGPLGSGAGAHTEYHYLPEAAPKGNWAISAYRHNLPESWYVRSVNEKKVLYQSAFNKDEHWHPMVTAGDELWQNYTIYTSFKPESKEKQCGIAFRVRNDRCYYFLGVKNDSAFLKIVNHELTFHKPNEKILASEDFCSVKDSFISVTINVDSNNIIADFTNGPSFFVTDTLFKKGKIGFLSDVPAAFGAIKITSLKKEAENYYIERRTKDSIELNLQKNNPLPVIWKKINTNGFGTARNIRFGDMDNDGNIDFLIGQIIHHGPKDRNSELSCLTAINSDGEILWQIGKPDPWKTNLTNDVAFQIHDIDNDGKNEVIYCMDQKIIIADGKTGKTKLNTSTPLTPGGKPTQSGNNSFERILGDCIYFCDLEGKGHKSNIILKDRYNYLWALNNKLQVLWKQECKTGHYPFSFDTDNDGKDEVLMGYSLFDDKGEKLWSLDSIIEDHADGVAIVRYKENNDPLVMCAASDEGMFFADLKGKILKHHYIGHVQNPAVANFRDDLPGLETVSVNFWGNQGIIHLFDSDGNIYYDFEPNQYGSMCLPLNWTGKSEEFFILNANVDEGGAYDGWGRKVLQFPDDGHPDMCYAVLDLTGDCRDEIIVWNPKEIWIYTQNNNSRNEKMFNPTRNPLYNYSNYQATISF